MELSKRKLKIGVLGGARGKALMEYCLKDADLALTAICDFNEEVAADAAAFCRENGAEVRIYRNFDDFIKEPFDAVILANYANEHAPFAIRCLSRGISVLSEVLPARDLAECVRLCEAVERSNAIYAYAENYCWFEIGREMKRLCDRGLLGEIEYAEGEYIHNCEPIWFRLTYGDKTHWRNKKTAFYYCTHSIGPIVHATGLRPVSVVGFEGKYNDKMRRMGALSAPFAVEMMTLENGAILRSTHGELTKNSIWFSLYGSLGRIESARNTDPAPTGTVYTSLDVSFDCTSEGVDSYVPPSSYRGEDAASDMHKRADFEMLSDFVAALRGEGGSYIDIYETMDMFLPGLFAFRSALLGGRPQAIPNFRNIEERERWKVLSEEDKKLFERSNAQLQPQIDEEVYERQKRQYEQYREALKGGTL